MNIRAFPPYGAGDQSFDRHADDKQNDQYYDCPDSWAEHLGDRGQNYRQYDSPPNCLRLAIDVATIVRIAFQGATTGTDHRLARENRRAKTTLLLTFANFSFDGRTAAWTSCSCFGYFLIAVFAVYKGHSVLQLFY
jgi:hypothetical protein